MPGQQQAELLGVAKSEQHVWGLDPQRMFLFHEMSVVKCDKDVQRETKGEKIQSYQVFLPAENVKLLSLLPGYAAKLICTQENI